MFFWSTYFKLGSEKVSQQCRENISAIQTLKDFKHIDKDGKDVGLNVREKTKSLVALLKNEERLKNERFKALKSKGKLPQSREIARLPKSIPVENPTSNPFKAESGQASQKQMPDVSGEITSTSNDARHLQSDDSENQTQWPVMQPETVSINKDLEGLAFYSLLDDSDIQKEFHSRIQLNETDLKSNIGAGHRETASVVNENQNVQQVKTNEIKHVQTTIPVQLPQINWNTSASKRPTVQEDTEPNGTAKYN